LRKRGVRIHSDRTERRKVGVLLRFQAKMLGFLDLLVQEAANFDRKAAQHVLENKNGPRHVFSPS
jgi:hypothetical protein